MPAARRNQEIPHAPRARSRAAGARAVVLAVLLAAMLVPGADAADFLPAVSLHLEAARYEPTKPDLHWMGLMGGGADLVEVGGVRGNIVGHVETMIGNTRRAFDASQANYHLEAGFWRRFGSVEVHPFFHHVSRHLSDRDKPEAVDWNMLGVRAEWRLGSDARGHLRASVGHTTLASLVGYRWEVIAAGDVDLVRHAHLTGYLSGGARLMTVDPDPAYPRGDFVDGLVEGGLRFASGPRELETYVAYEHRNDVYLTVPGALDRALFGLRIRLNKGD